MTGKIAQLHSVLFRCTSVEADALESRRPRGAMADAGKRQSRGLMSSKSTAPATGGHGAAGAAGLPKRLKLNLNVSPSVILLGNLAEALGDFDRSRIVIEITEHVHIDNYAAINEALQPLRISGCKVAIDDAGFCRGGHSAEAQAKAGWAFVHRGIFG